jgi:predicted amidohydrolase
MHTAKPFAIGLFVFVFLCLSFSPFGPVARAQPPGELLCAAEGWKAFAPRAADVPSSRVLPGKGAAYALKLASGGKRFVYGGWRCRVEGIEPGGWYRFQARARPAKIASLRESVSVQLRWRGDFGGEVAPAYVWDFSKAGKAGEAIEFDGMVEAPPKSRAVDVELVLQWTLGEVTWEALSLTRAPAPAPRKVKIAAVWLRPRGQKTGAGAVQQFAEYADRVATEHHPDVIVLGEMINHVGVSGSLDSVAEPVPGPTTERLGELARRHSTYIAFSVVEREGADLFNAGILLDRSGKIAGKYRKVQLPFEELSAGVAPGDSFPVFTTDFGKVGIMICHDASFVEPARELALNGAELILLPIWGGRQPLVRARAIENGVYLAAAGYDYDSEIVDPLGHVLASIPHDKGAGVAVAEIDLGKRFREDWIGDWRATVNKQRRAAPYRYRIP